MHHYQSTRGQRIFILFIIFILPIFLFREYKLLSEKKNGMIITEDTYYETHPKQDIHHHFAIIVPVYSNDISLLRNAQSIYEQTYSDFHVEYILNNPPREYVEELQNHFGKGGRQHTISIHRTQSQEAFFQKYVEIVRSCDNETVVVHLNGADWFANEDVLKSFDSIYQNQDVWLTYSQYMDFPKLKKGKSKASDRGRYFGKRVHRAPWVTSHCKTFYARIFKEFFASSTQVRDYCLSFDKLDGLLVPVADIGKMHVRFIPQVLYVHADLYAIKKRAMTLGNFGERCTEAILKKKEAETGVNEDGCDAFIFSCDTPETLHHFLASAQQNISGINDVFIFYTTKKEEGYTSVKKAYPNYLFFNVSLLSGEELKETISQAIATSGKSNRYLFMAHDSASITRQITLGTDSERLRDARASALYYHLGSEREAFQTSLQYAATRFCGGGYYSWNLRKGKQAFEYPDTFAATLYSSRFVERFLHEAKLSSLEDLFLGRTSPVNGVGMFNIDASVHLAE